MVGWRISCWCVVYESITATSQTETFQLKIELLLRLGILLVISGEIAN